MSKDSGQTGKVAQRPCKHRCHCNRNPQKFLKAAVSLLRPVAGQQRDRKGSTQKAAKLEDESE